MTLRSVGENLPGEASAHRAAQIASKSQPKKFFIFSTADQINTQIEGS